MNPVTVPTTEVKWFLHLNGQVRGPFNNDALQSTLQGLSEEGSTLALVWKRGLPEWIKATQWQLADQQIKATENTENQTSDSENTVAEDGLFEKTFTQSFIDGTFYQVKVDSVEQPPMSKVELMTLIAKQQDVSKISIQDPKTKVWKAVYEFPDIVERLGLSRRKESRVPVLAQFTGKSNHNNDVSYRVITISPGGMGFTENYELKIGDAVEGQLSSPHFFQPLNLKADVIYAGQDGYVGLKFSQIADEARSAIIDYVKKFGKTSANTT